MPCIWNVCKLQAHPDFCEHSFRDYIGNQASTAGSYRFYHITLVNNIVWWRGSDFSKKYKIIKTWSYKFGNNFRNFFFLSWLFAVVVNESEYEDLWAECSKHLFFLSNPSLVVKILSTQLLAYLVEFDMVISERSILSSKLSYLVFLYCYLITVVKVKPG